MLLMEQTDWTAVPETRAARVTGHFRERFAGEPELWARAPGRVPSRTNEAAVCNAAVPPKQACFTSKVRQWRDRPR